MIFVGGIRIGLLSWAMVGITLRMIASLHGMLMILYRRCQGDGEP